MKWNKTEGEYSVGFRVQISSKQIGDLLEKYSNNHDISLNYPPFMKGEKEIRLLLEGKTTVS